MAGTRSSEHDQPVGSTDTVDAPAATACEIAALLTTPPSMKTRPSITTGANTPGIEALARTALTTEPCVILTSRPDRTAVAITYKTTGASSM